MGRSIFIVLLWVATLCVFSIRVEFVDGLRINLVGWPEAVGKWRKARKEARNG